ncbi:hypothetical protein IG631_04300 [Alternaria alternata]|nr:hypothetical protein IG631_04300 [Alternaria alternata]
MSHNTPDSLLKLAADLNKLGGELCAIGGKLAQAATTLEQEAANVALTNAQRWGVDVQEEGAGEGFPRTQLALLLQGLAQQNFYQIIR